MTGPPEKYPWQEWLGTRGDRKRIFRGRHFDCQPHSMAVQLRNKADKYGFRISLQIKDGCITINNLGRKQKNA